MPTQRAYRRGLFTVLVLLCACGTESTPPPGGTTLVCLAPVPGAEEAIQSAGLPVAPASARVDLTEPSFSNPTDVSNPLNPIRDLHSAVLLGMVDGEPFRAETTLLATTRVIDCHGVMIEALESQYMAFLDGRIEEVAIDWYAQSDDGSVWYLGEDVFNYSDGAVADTEGTWLAGRDGPGALIMPGNPQAGDAYRPENLYPSVFEEVTVREIGATVDGPRGPVSGALLVSELHMDGTREDKTFAPAYGEFFTGDVGGDVEALALAVPTDALSGAMPTELDTVSARAAEIHAAAVAGDFAAAATALDALTTAWTAYRGSGVPPRLETQMTAAVDALDAAITAAVASDVEEMAIRVALANLDFRLRYAPVAEIDRARFDQWAAMLLVDASIGAGGDVTAAGDVQGDVTTLEWVWRRFAHTLPATAVSRVETLLAELRRAADAADFAAATTAGGQLREMLAGL